MSIELSPRFIPLSRDEAAKPEASGAETAARTSTSNKRLSQPFLNGLQSSGAGASGACAKEPEVVPYDKDQHGDLTAFDRSALGDAIRHKYSTRISEFQRFLASGEPVARQDSAIKNLNDFVVNLNMGVNGQYKDAMQALYNDMSLGAIDRIEAETRDKGVQPTRLKQAMINMSDGMVMCPTAASSFLMIADQKLQLAKKGLGGLAREWWEERADQVLQDFAELEHGHEPNGEGNYVHMVNGYRAFIAQRYHLECRRDDLMPPHIGEPERIERLEAYLKRHLTPEHLIQQFAADLLAEVHKHFPQYVGRPLDVVEAQQFHEEFEKKLSGVLEKRFGIIDSSVVLSEHHGELANDDDEERYYLINNPTLLMRTIGKNLVEAGVLEESKPSLVVGTKRTAEEKANTPARDPVVIKSFGDSGFYSKKRVPTDAYSPMLKKMVTAYEKVYKPLSSADLEHFNVSHPKYFHMMRATLQNTKNEDQLREVSPQAVWDMLVRHEPKDLVGWLAPMSSPEVMRYRKASPKHEAFLLDQAIKTIEALPPDQKASQTHSVLLSALHQEDSALLAKFAPLLDAVDANRVDRATRRNVLHLAAMQNRTDLVRDWGSKAQDSAHQWGDKHGNTPLILAAGKGNVEVVKALLASGHSMIEQSNAFNGRTALIQAIEAGKSEMIDTLLDLGANFDEHDMYQWTPSMYAAMSGKPAAIQRLHDKGADLGKTSADGQTPLSLAAQYGKAETIEKLNALKPGLLDQRDMYGLTPLMHAVLNKQTEAVKTLLALGASQENLTQDDFKRIKDNQAVQYLRSKGINLPYNLRVGQSPLVIAANVGDVEAMKALLSAGADINAQSLGQKTSPLMAAVGSGSEEALELMLKQSGIEVDAKNVDGTTALLYAAFRGEVGMVKKLIAAGAAFDAKNNSGMSPLALAARNGHAKALKDLYDLDPSQLDALDDYNYTPMLRACASKNSNETVKALLDLAPHPRALLSAHGKDGMTPMLYAAKLGDAELIEKFSALGAYAMEKDDVGQTAVSLAAQFGHVNAIKALHRHNAASIDARDDFNYTPLMHAAFNNQSEAVKTLLDLGASQTNATFNEFRAAMSNTARENIRSAGMSYTGNWHAGHTPFMVTALRGKVDDLKMLWATGIDVNEAAQGDHRTGMMIAVGGGRSDIVDALLQHPEIDVNRKTLDGRTALMFAVQTGQVELAKKLIAGGADVNIKNAQGKTAHQLIPPAYRQHFGKILLPDSLRARMGYQSSKAADKVGDKLVKATDKVSGKMTSWFGRSKRA